jgi:hypothetical protein
MTRNPGLLMVDSPALLSPDRLDGLVQLLLEETVGRANMKTVTQSCPAVPFQPQLFTALQGQVTRQIRFV